MTNNRAVEIMKAIIFILKNDDYSDEVEEAIHMAINALKAQESCNKLATNLQPSKQDADDTISRQAAIDAMSESLKRVFPEHRQIAKKCLGVLPSAQPDLEEDKDIPMEYFENGGI